MSVDVEILEFCLPTGNRKNILISGIPHLPEEEVVETIYQIFSKYGPIYGTHIYSYGGQVSEKNQTGGSEPSTSAGFYAFVTFYLAMSARRAKEETKGKVMFGNVECKIAYAKKKRDGPAEPQNLHFSKCQELANMYIGFNGWSTTVKFTDTEVTEIDSETLSFCHVCVTRLDLPKHGLHTEGMGAWKETFVKRDPCSKGKAACKAKKIAYQRSMENAFSKVLLIILSNGKVSVEVDTTRPELLLTEKDIDDDNLLKVNELDEDPESSFEYHSVVSENTDDVNLHILQQLEEEG